MTSGEHLDPDGRILLAVSLPGLGWWFANVGLVTLGVLDYGDFGYRAWRRALSEWPQWLEDAFAYFSVAAWFTLLLAFGALLAVKGRPAIASAAFVLLATTAAAVATVCVGTWLYPDG